MNQSDIDFRYLLFNRVKSEKGGFVVKMRVLSGYVEYREQNRIITVPVGLEVGSAVVHISKDSALKWKPPYDKEVVSEAKKEEILHNVCEALKFAKCTVELA